MKDLVRGGATMLYAQRRMTITVFFLMPFLLMLVAVALSTPTQAETGKAKVDRLVMGLINPYHDYVRPWISGTADHNIQHDPMLEWLFEIDAETDKGQAEWKMIGTKDTPVQVEENIAAGNILKYNEGLTDFTQYEKEDDDLILYQ